LLPRWRSVSHSRTERCAKSTAYCAPLVHRVHGNIGFVIDALACRSHARRPRSPKRSSASLVRVWNICATFAATSWLWDSCLAGFFIALSVSRDGMRHPIEVVMQRTLGLAACRVVSERSPFGRNSALVSGTDERLVASGDVISTVLMRAYPDEAIRLRAYQAGVVCYLSKLFSPEELCECIRSALATRPIPKS
jgi:CheY-like chemotaxis protein